MVWNMPRYQTIYKVRKERQGRVDVMKNLDIKLSPNFTLGELLKSRTASKKGIDNSPSPEHIENLRNTCIALQGARRILGHKSMTVTSGYRCLALNRALGSSDNSYHTTGHAADVKVKGVPLIDVAKALAEVPLIDKVILEEMESGRKWVHVQISKAGEIPRQQWFVATDETGKVEYHRVERDFVTPYSYE